MAPAKVVSPRHLVVHGIAAIMVAALSILSQASTAAARQVDAAASAAASQGRGLSRGQRNAAFGALVLILLQGATITWLLVERRRQRRAAVVSGRHVATLKHMDARIAAGELTASMAHEVNQPLGAILRNAEAATMLLATDTPPIDELRAILDDIRADDRRASELIRRIRRSIEKRESRAAAVDLGQVARAGCGFVRPDAVAKGVRLSLELPPAPVLVTGDAVHLEQVVLNLMMNGVDAATAGNDRRRQVMIRVSSTHDTAELSVTDSGPGFAAEALSRLFDPFFTTRDHGMGIGLAVSRSIIEAHAGRILAANDPGGGATVRVLLPQRREEATTGS